MAAIMTLSLQKLLETDRIPSLPEVALRVVELAQAPEPDLEEIIRVIKGDPAICSRVMRTVNSALFGLRRRVYEGQPEISGFSGRVGSRTRLGEQLTGSAR